MFKHLICLIGLLASGALFAQPITNIEEFQAEIEQCIKSPSPDTCLNKLLPSRYPSGNEEMLKIVPQVTSIIPKWLNGDKLYAIHPIKQTKVGDLVDRRIYILESDTSGFLIMEVSYIRLKGNWHLWQFNVTSNPEKVDALFSGDPVKI